MLLTLSTTMPEARDLGFLLHKHPDRPQSTVVSAGVAHVLWPQADAERATMALLLEVDPIALVRGGARGADGFSLAQHVSDRPYAAGSLLAVALGKLFRTAMAGRCDARPDLVDRPVPLEVHFPSLPSRGGAELCRRLLAPLGWDVRATPLPLDPEQPAWGDSAYVALTASATMTVADALTQLYVLLPVLDDAKHYWVGDDEVDKLLRAGGTWLAAHPERELITARYLRHARSLVTTATDRLAERDDAASAADDDDANDKAEPPRPLAARRREAVVAVLKAEQARRVVDVGCGEGTLLRELIADPAFTAVVGVDVSGRALERAERRLQLDRMPDSQRDRLQLLQSSVTYRDDRLAGYDALVLMEVVEHIDPERLPALERSVFGHARPGVVLVTTPNAEHNVRFPDLPAGALRHRDHRFEWTREEFRAWAQACAERYGYAVRYEGVGDDDAEVGPPTQLAAFRLCASRRSA